MPQPPKHDWLYTIGNLPDPPVLRRKQFENIKETIEEVQEFAVRGARCVDDSVDVWVEHGEVLVAAFATGSVQRLSTTIQVCTVPDWTSPVLSYTPINIVIKDGMIQSIDTLPSVTIDTAESC